MLSKAATNIVIKQLTPTNVPSLPDNKLNDGLDNKLIKLAESVGAITILAKDKFVDINDLLSNKALTGVLLRLGPTSRAAAPLYNKDNTSSSLTSVAPRTDITTLYPRN